MISFEYFAVFIIAISFIHHYDYTIHAFPIYTIKRYDTTIRKRLFTMKLDNSRIMEKKGKTSSTEDFSGYIPDSRELDAWDGRMEGFDWELEKARRAFLGPGYAPFSMTLWQPQKASDSSPPNMIDQWKILFNNALQMTGLAESMDGAPLVQGVNTFKGNPIQLLSRVLDGDLAQLAGGPLFLLLANYYKEYGPIFKLAFGPKSFIVVSDPVMVKYILKENPLNYDKGILAEILEPVMGKGLIPADPETWKVRRKAIVPGFHKAWLDAMMSLFVKCNEPLIDKLSKAVKNKEVLNMETEFCSVSLDIIGKAVFNYHFGSVTQESPVVKAVYRALQEAEHRSTSFIPYWDLPFAKYYSKKLQDFEKNMEMLNKVLDELIVKALSTQNQQDVEDLEKRDYNTMENTSLLRFLVDMRGEDTTSKQLRDDLMTMLIAGHETTAAVLTWTMFELSQNQPLLTRVQYEIDTVLKGRSPTYDDMINLPLVRLCLAETLRMYPEPPLLIRRALSNDILPKGGAKSTTFIPKGTDIFISTWNIHRSPEFWENPNVYDPDRFQRNFKNINQPDWGGYTPAGGTGKQLYPNEVHSDFAFLPFGGGSRKCVGDQFAMMESITTIALILQKFELKLSIPAKEVGMRTVNINTNTNNSDNLIVKEITEEQINFQVKISLGWAIRNYQVATLYAKKKNVLKESLLIALDKIITFIDDDIDCISYYYAGRDRGGYSKMQKEFTPWGKALLQIIRNNDNIKDIADNLKLEEERLKSMFNLAICKVIPNLNNNSKNSNLIISTIYNALTNKIIHQRCNQIVKNFREDYLSRYKGHKAVTLRTELKISTCKHQQTNS